VAGGCTSSRAGEQRGIRKGVRRLRTTGQAAAQALLETQHEMFRFGLKDNPMDPGSHGYVDQLNGRNGLSCMQHQVGKHGPWSRTAERKRNPISGSFDCPRAAWRPSALPLEEPLDIRSMVTAPA
jgi:hypothetical protein